MYGRVISFTLLAPSLWSVVESIGSKKNDGDYKRFLFKSAENEGFLVDLFHEWKPAGHNIEYFFVSFSLKCQLIHFYKNKIKTMDKILRQ